MRHTTLPTKVNKFLLTGMFVVPPGIITRNCLQVY